MQLQIRRINTYVEETFSEAGIEADVPLRKVAVVAIIKNEFAGRYVEDISPYYEASRELCTRITNMAKDALAPYEVQSYGKGGVVGINGEQDHAVALLTTVYGNVMREIVGGGKAWVSSATKRAQPGATIDIPLAYKDALYVRSHYDAMSITLHDAPLPDEIAVICVLANRGRLNERCGGLSLGEAKKEDGLV